MYIEALNYFNNGNYIEAKNLLINVIKNENDVTNINEAKILLGIIYNIQNNENNAIPLFLEVLNTELNYDALINIGYSYLNLNEYSQAIIYFEKCRYIDDKNNNINLLIGNCNMGLKNIKEAIINYETEININPYSVKAYNALGNIYLSQDDWVNSIKCFRNAETIDSNDITTKFNIAIYYNNCLDLENSLIYYNEIIKLQPNFYLANYNAGIVALNLKKYLLSIEYFNTALKLNKYSFEIHNNLGVIYNKLEDFELSLEHFDLSIKINKSYSIAYFNKANLLENINKYNEAENNYKKALSLDRNNSVYLYNLAHLLFKMNEYNKSIDILNKCIQINTNFSNAYSLIGLNYMHSNNLEKSEFYFTKSILLNNYFHEGHNNLGLLFLENNRFEEALLQFKKCIEIEPNNSKYHFNIAICYHEMYTYTLFNYNIEKAIELDVNFGDAIWVKTFLSVLPVYETKIDENDAVDSFHENLLILKENKINITKIDLIGSYQPFYMAYFDNNNKDIFTLYGEICDNIIKKNGYSNLLIKSKSKSKSYSNSNVNKNESNQFNLNKKIKIGIISSYFRTHSVWDAIIKGILLKLNKNIFEIHIFNTSTINVDNNFFNFNNFKSVNNKKNISFVDYISLIVSKNLDVIIYPEIGMNKLTTQLANLKIADLQCVFWGHPHTTGLKTIDYYISSELFEPLDFNDHYTEKVIKLSNLGIYKEEEIHDYDYNFSLEEIGINNLSPILICAGTFQKYRADNDLLFLEIIKKLGVCQIIFMSENKHKTQLFRDRLTKLLETNNIDINKYIHFIDWLEKRDFFSLLLQSDVYLDTIGFSGFNTALLAIEANLPIVTINGKYARGRLAAGILKRINLTELVCKNTEQYKNLVIQICSNLEYKQILKEKIQTNKKIIYKDDIPMIEFENFIMNKFHINI